MPPINGAFRSKIHIVRTTIVTGSAGLIGSETVKRFARDGARVVGIDNDMRAQFSARKLPTNRTRDDLVKNVRGYEHHNIDIRDAAKVRELFKQHRGKIDAVVHTAAQPSHDWAARDPQTDFTVNANGTLNLLEAAREFLSRKRRSFLHRQTRFTATRQTGCHCVSWRNAGKLRAVTNTSREFPRR